MSVSNFIGKEIYQMNKINDNNLSFVGWFIKGGWNMFSGIRGAHLGNIGGILLIIGIVTTKYDFRFRISIGIIGIVMIAIGYITYKSLNISYIMKYIGNILMMLGFLSLPAVVYSGFSVDTTSRFPHFIGLVTLLVMISYLLTYLYSYIFPVYKMIIN